MPFCGNCGKELAEESNFCAYCGATVRENNSNKQRKTIYEGEIHKCPQCGEILNAFVSVCPSCYYELRGTKSANSIKEFFTRIEKITSSEQKATLIRNYPIPNTKEDIFEFLILASSNITGESSEKVFNAWLVKIEQCYQKASVAFSTDLDFAKIQNIYERTAKQINRERAIHGANKIGAKVSRFIETFPNPIFRIVAALLGVYEIVRLVKGDFAGIDIVMVTFILWSVYKITNKKK